MRKINSRNWEVTQDDVEKTRIVREGNTLRFTPVGATSETVIAFGSICGCVSAPSIHLQCGRFPHGNGGILTHEQARELLAFLKAYEPFLNDPAPAAGDVHEFGWPLTLHDGAE